MAASMAMAINDKRQQIASRAIGQSFEPIESLKSNCRIAGWIDGSMVGIAGIVVYCLLLTFSVSLDL